MGLKMTLDKDMNHMYHTFNDAYWVIDNIRTDVNGAEVFVSFSLCAYPSRESWKKKNMSVEYGLTIGASENIAYSPVLYSWFNTVNAKTLFGSTMPLSTDEQKTVIYNWIKEYTGLPFEDVFEE